MPDNSKTNNISPVATDPIKDKIYTIRGVQVMLDSDLAELYDTKTKFINQSVKRNIERFPDRYFFQLTNDEFNNLRSHFATSSLNDNYGGRRYLPYVFTEQGVAMLAGVLKSDVAIKVSINIIDAFVSMRHFLADNAGIFQRLDRIEMASLEFRNESETKFNEIFKRLEVATPGNSVIFFNGSFYDAKSFIADLIKRAKTKIILIDDYISKVTLDILRQRNNGVSITLITQSNPKNSDKLSAQEVDNFKKQYGNLTLKYNDTFHDRFLILDDTELYSIGASLKDAGNKTFAINKIADKSLIDILITRV